MFMACALGATSLQAGYAAPDSVVVLLFSMPHLDGYADTNSADSLTGCEQDFCM